MRRHTYVDEPKEQRHVKRTEKVHPAGIKEVRNYTQVSLPVNTGKYPGGGAEQQRNRAYAWGRVRET